MNFVLDVCEYHIQYDVVFYYNSCRMFNNKFFHYSLIYIYHCQIDKL